jgi:tRNA pseudouridine38-40 synthase
VPKPSGCSTKSAKLHCSIPKGPEAIPALSIFRLPFVMRIALGIEYDGTDFLGWQRLTRGSTVQGALEPALSFVANHPVEVSCAGRTDAGVHASGQVVHFDSESVRTPFAWIMGTNSRLPASAAVTWACAVDQAFHARFSARARRYRYRLLNRRIRPALDARFVAWERLPLDAPAMHQAARGLLGAHDFSAFRTSQCQAPNPVRDMQVLDVARHGEEIVFDVQANAFLHHMVRNLVGTLLMVGRGEKDIAWPAQVLAGRDRNKAGPTAPSAGLTFLGPRYPAEWKLPAAVTL